MKYKTRAGAVIAAFLTWFVKWFVISVCMNYVLTQLFVSAINQELMEFGITMSCLFALIPQLRFHCDEHENYWTIDS